jgi:hypothetical protein
VNGKESWVKGNYNIAATSGSETYPIAGNWKVELEKDEDMGYWYINSVQIEGIKF